MRLEALGRYPHLQRVLGARWRMSCDLLSKILAPIRYGSVDTELIDGDCEGEVIVQGDEGPVCGVAQVVDCHGVTVGHQEREEEEEQQEVEGEGEKHSKNNAHVHGWDEYEKTSASGLEPCGVMND